MKSADFVKMIKDSVNRDDWRSVASELCGSGHEVTKLDSKYCPELLKELFAAGITLISEDGYGGEGCGDEYWGVFSVIQGYSVTSFKISGWYASYSGSEVDVWDLTEVKKVPIQTYEWVSV